VAGVDGVVGGVDGNTITSVDFSLTGTVTTTTSQMLHQVRQLRERVPKAETINVNATGTFSVRNGRRTPTSTDRGRLSTNVGGHKGRYPRYVKCHLTSCTRRARPSGNFLSSNLSVPARHELDAGLLRSRISATLWIGSLCGGPGVG
jgi:hypothetical protein